MPADDDDITFPLHSSHPAVVAFGDALQVVIDDNLQHQPEDIRAGLGWALAAEVICYPAGRAALAALASAVADVTPEQPRVKDGTIVQGHARLGAAKGLDPETRRQIEHDLALHDGMPG